MKKKLKSIAFRIMSVFLLSTLIQISFMGALNASESEALKQDIPITGKVTDDDGKGLPGANIVVKGTTVGTVTDLDGNFSISVANKDVVLVFSSIGYLDEEVLVGNQIVINMSMVMDITALQEIVVVGYGTQQAKEVTGSIASVTSKDISGLQITGLDQALTGKIAGVQVTQNSGEPGGSVSIKIRGPGSINSSSDPLYIIDGVPYGNLNSINTNDIQRIDVLKDAASAAIYGSRASNGVVIVTTKRGRQGKIVVDLDAYYGIQKIAKELDLLDGPQFAKLANENLVNSGLDPNPAWSEPSKVHNTDWQDAILQTAPIQSYNIAISGGSEKSSTRVSFGYFNQDGIVIGSDYNRYTARLNSDYNVLDNLKVGVRLNTSFVDNNRVSSNNAYGGVLENASYSHPTTPIYTDAEGLFGLNSDGTVDPSGDTFYGWNGQAFTSREADVNMYPSGVSNVKYATDTYTRSRQKSQSTLMAAFVEWEVIPGLSAKSSFNFTYDNGFNTSGKDAAPFEMDQKGAYSMLSKYNEAWTQGHQWNWINTISYKKQINNHAISAVVGVDVLKNFYQGVYIGTSDVLDGQQSINASGPDRTVSGDPIEESLVSVFGRVSYDYMQKYLVSAIVRRDGSSKFGPDSQWAVFPSVSAGWRIAEESFMESLTFLDELKLRGSYGEVGNQNIDNFQYLNTFSRQVPSVKHGTMPYNYTLGNDKRIVGAAYADNIGVPNIHWEKSVMKNFGIDAIFLNHKFTLTAEYYIKTLEDLLGEFPVPDYTGVYDGSILKNGFSMENRGFELALGYNERIGDFNFSINGNFSALSNKILKLTDEESAYIAYSISEYTRSSTNDGDAHTRTMVGESLATFYGYKTNGIAKTQDDIDNSGMTGIELGDRLYKDLSGPDGVPDGIIDANDRVALGNGMPDYIFGLSLKADYKGFDFSMLLDGQAGVEIANVIKFTRYNMRSYDSFGLVNVSTDLLDSWSPENPDSELPRNAYYAPTSNRWFSDFNVENGAFVRIRNIQLGYTLPEVVSQKAGMSRTRVYVSAQNLLTITNYSGYDPEIGSKESVLETGVDYGRYPASKMFIVGAQITF